MAERRTAKRHVPCSRLIVICRQEGRIFNKTRQGMRAGDGVSRLLVRTDKEGHPGVPLGEILALLA